MVEAADRGMLCVRLKVREKRATLYGEGDEKLRDVWLNIFSL